MVTNENRIKENTYTKQKYFGKIKHPKLVSKHLKKPLSDELVW